MADKVKIEYDAEINSLIKRYDEIINRLTAIDQKVDQTTKNTNKNLKNTGKEVDVLGNQFNRLAGYITSAFAVGSLIEFGQQIVDVTRKTELLQNQLNFVAGSAEGGERLFRQLQKTAKDLGIEFTSLAKGYSGFAIAAKQNNISAQQSLVIYTNFAKGLRGAGASAQATERAFYALEQMMSKGKVSSEELRLQMAEALPGATAIAAKAMGVTTAEFNKMLETGQIISADFIPKFAEAVQNEFTGALSGKSNSLDASLQRGQTSLENFQRAIGDRDKGAFKAVVDFSSEALNDLTVMINSRSIPAVEGLYAAIRKRLGLSNQIDNEIEANELNRKSLEKRAKQELGFFDASKASLSEIKTRYSFLNAQVLEYKNLQKEAQSSIEKYGQSVLPEIIENEKLYGTTVSFAVEEMQSLSNIINETEKERKEAAEARKEDEALFLKNALALAQIRLLESKGGLDTLQAERGVLDARFKLEVNNEKKTADEKKLIQAQYSKDVIELNKRTNDAIEDATSGRVEEESVDMNSAGMKGLQLFLDITNKKKKAEDEAIDKRIKGEVDAFNATEDLEKKRLKLAKERAMGTLSVVASSIQQINQIQSEAIQQDAENAIRRQDELREKGLLSEQQYEQNVNAIRARAFEQNKEARVKDAKISAALAIIRAFSDLGPIGGAIAAIAIGAATNEQINFIQAQSLPTFHEGGIDIGKDSSVKKTKGRLKPDEFIAKLQTHESVMDREETRMYKDELEAMRSGNYEKYIAQNYIAPALKRSKDEAGRPDSSATSMEIAYQNAELANLIRSNKTVRLHKQTVEELGAVISRGTTSGKARRRGGWQ